MVWIVLPTMVSKDSSDCHLFLLSGVTFPSRYIVFYQTNWIAEIAKKYSNIKLNIWYYGFAADLYESIHILVWWSLDMNISMKRNLHMKISNTSYTWNYSGNWID